MVCARLPRSLARGEAGALSLAFVSAADYGLLPQLLREFTARYSAVRLQLVEATSDVQVEEIVAGPISAGLVIPPLPPRHAMALSYLPVAREPLVIAMSNAIAVRLRQSSDEWALSSVSLREFAEEPLVVFPRFMTLLWATTRLRASRRGSDNKQSKCKL